VYEDSDLEDLMGSNVDIAFNGMTVTIFSGSIFIDMA